MRRPQYAFEVLEHGTTVALTLSTTDKRFQSLDTSMVAGTEAAAVEDKKQRGGGGKGGRSGGGGHDDPCIGFVVMGLTGSKNRSTKFHPLKMKAQSPGFKQVQSISTLCTLRAGRYAVVPSTFDPEPEPLNFVLEIFSSNPLVLSQKGDEMPDGDELDESDDEELGPIDGMGVEQVPKDDLDPENNGKELEALSTQAGELALFIKSLVGDIKNLEERVNVLMPPASSLE